MWDEGKNVSVMDLADGSDEWSSEEETGKEEIIPGSRLLDALMLVLPLVPQIVGMELQISLCSRTTVLGVWQAKTFFLPGAQSGVELSYDNPAQRNMLEAMASGKSRVDILPKELLGEPIRGIVTPVFEDGEVVGVITCASSLKDMDNLKTSAENLFTNLTQTQNAVEEIAGGASSLAEKIYTINRASEIVTQQVKKAVECVTAIQNNANRSNILALNGSIEAARTGEAGKGFAVIANEMRKFSQVSGDTAKMITASLKEVSGSITVITDEMNEVNSVATNQAAATEEITASLNDITDQASKLVKINEGMTK
jgi:hypothetical protein